MIVGFNYRSSPIRTLMKQVLMSGVIGHVKNVTFEWLLDTHHGADYFRRWPRRKENSGGLFVHKATHHFDLLNWWLGAAVELASLVPDVQHPDFTPEPFGPRAIWQRFDASRYPFLGDALIQ